MVSTDIRWKYVKIADAISITSSQQNLVLRSRGVQKSWTIVWSRISLRWVHFRRVPWMLHCLIFMESNLSPKMTWVYTSMASVCAALATSFWLRWWLACGLNDLLLLVFHSYRYEWLMEETEKNVLRTHTTAVSARMLYKLAQQVSVHVGVCGCLLQAVQ